MRRVTINEIRERLQDRRLEMVSGATAAPILLLLYIKINFDKRREHSH